MMALSNAHVYKSRDPILIPAQVRVVSQEWNLLLLSKLRTSFQNIYKTSQLRSVKYRTPFFGRCQHLLQSVMAKSATAIWKSILCRPFISKSVKPPSQVILGPAAAFVQNTKKTKNFVFKFFQINPPITNGQ